MGKSKPPESTRSVFRFSYREHEWDDGERDEEEFAQQFLQVAREQNWTPTEIDDPSDLDYFMAPEVTTVEELRAHCEEVIADFEYPDGLLEAPFEKLKTKMKAEGWKFVGGIFNEFEGNHDDTHINVVLEKAEQQPAKKATAKKPAKKAPAKKAPAKKPKPAKKTVAKKKK